MYELKNKSNYDKIYTINQKKTATIMAKHTKSEVGAVMRMKDLHMMLVYNEIITYKMRTKKDLMREFCRGEEDTKVSSESKEKAEKQENCVQDFLLAERTLERYLQELKQEGMIVQDKEKDGKYKLPKEDKVLSNLEKEYANELIARLMFLQEVELAKEIVQDCNCDMKMIEQYQKRILGRNTQLSYLVDKLDILEKAISTGEQIDFMYRGKKIHKVKPICILINRDMTKIYLSGVQSKKQLGSYLVQYIDNIEWDKSSIEEKIKSWRNSESLQYDSKLKIRGKNTEEKTKISLINEAVSEKLKILMEINGKRTYIVPFGFLTDSDGKVRSIGGIGMDEKFHDFRNFDNFDEVKIVLKEESKDYREKIKKAWDVDMGSSNHVKVLVKPGRKDTVEVEREIGRHLSRKEQNEKGSIYEGEIVGINDFKKWIRLHVATCVILEPVELRKDIQTSLIKSMERYQEAKDEEGN